MRLIEREKKKMRKKLTKNYFGICVRLVLIICTLILKIYCLATTLHSSYELT